MSLEIGNSVMRASSGGLRALTPDEILQVSGGDASTDLGAAAELAGAASIATGLMGPEAWGFSIGFGLIGLGLGGASWIAGSYNDWMS
jgi:hypothetical protein